MPRWKRKKKAPQSKQERESVPDYIPQYKRVRQAEAAEDAANRRIGQALTGRMCPSEEDVISKLKSVR